MPGFFGDTSGYISSGAGNPNTGYDSRTGGIVYNQAADASLWQGLENQFTGNLDYQRDLQLQNINNSFNAAEAKKSRDWQEYMSNTAYQRQAADLIAAGYNPALVLGAGGASAYSAATASASGVGRHSSGAGFDRVGSVLGTMLRMIIMQGAANSREAAALQTKQEIASNKLDYLYDKLNEQSNANDAFLEAKKLDLEIKEKRRLDDVVRSKNHESLDLAKYKANVYRGFRA